MLHRLGRLRQNSGAPALLRPAQRVDALDDLRPVACLRLRHGGCEIGRGPRLYQHGREADARPARVGLGKRVDDGLGVRQAGALPQESAGVARLNPASPRPRTASTPRRDILADGPRIAAFGRLRPFPGNPACCEVGLGASGRPCARAGPLAQDPHRVRRPSGDQLGTSPPPGFRSRHRLRRLRG